jgi:hypothetical protein
MKTTQAAWAAGMFDADGCVRVRRQRKPEGIYYALMIDITQSGEIVPNSIVLLARLFGGTPLPSKDHRPGRQRRWSWRLSSQQAASFLRAILPYAVGKREQIKLGLEFQKRATGRHGPRRNVALQESYYQHISALKHYRKSDQ